ncbi:unnamed protein product [Lactuca virosa]|uniref:Uncharacterized protein n=1 Tax=Lactuca virosa TaxID=75947 RepID=A0AAU9PK00_9ASTR|nr:unnamed protein product [Lactuca virosa]
MVDVDVVSDGNGLDMQHMDYIIQKIAQLRKSGYNDVDIMRCLGITKAHLEEFGYVVVNVEGETVQGNGVEGGVEHGHGDGVEDVHGNEEEGGLERDRQGDEVEGGGEGKGNEEEEREVEGNEEEYGEEGEGDGEEDGDGEGDKGDREGDEVEGVEDEDVQGNKEGGEGVEVVPVNDPVHEGHFGNNVQQRTRRTLREDHSSKAEK